MEEFELILNFLLKYWIVLAIVIVLIVAIFFYPKDVLLKGQDKTLIVRGDNNKITQITQITQINRKNEQGKN